MVWGDTVTKLQTFVWIFKHVSRISYGTTRAFQECGQNREKFRYTNYALRKPCFYHPILATERVNRRIIVLELLIFF